MAVTKGWAYWGVRSIATLISASLLLFAFLVFLPLSGAKAYNDGQAAKWGRPVPKMAAEVAAAVELMRANGIYAATGGDPVLLAMAIHESDGDLGAINKKGKKGSPDGAGVAFCAFQIYHTNIPNAAYRQRLLTDPAFCTETGRNILNNFVSRHGFARGLCYYGGQRTELNETGTCAMAREIPIIMDLLDGSLEGYADTDINSDHYGDTTLTGPNTGTITILNCEARTHNLASKLAKAVESYKNTTQVKAYESYDETMRAEAGAPAVNIRGDIRFTYCIEGFDTYFDQIISLILDKFNIISLIQDLVDDILRFACTYVTSVIDSVLGSICIPMFDVFSGISLPDIGLSSRRSCSGYSLADVLQVQMSNTPFATVRTDSSRGMPLVDGLPSIVPSGAGMGELLRLR